MQLDMWPAWFRHNLAEIDRTFGLELFFLLPFEEVDQSLAALLSNLLGGYFLVGFACLVRNLSDSLSDLIAEICMILCVHL